MPPRIAAEIAGPAMRRAAIALLSLLVVGDAAIAQQPAKPKAPAAVAPQPGKPSAADGGKCIGVVSAIGDTFFSRKIGITVFGNGQSTAPVESWHVDDVVVSKISAFLSKGWTVRRINYPKGAFASLDGQHALFYNYDDDLQGIVRRVTSSTRCDHYVVVVKGSSSFGTSNQSIYGLGIVEATSILGASDYIHALFTIRIYDGQTFAMLSQRGASIEKWNLLSDFKGPGIHGPYRAVDNSLWPQSDAAQSTKLRDGIRSLVEQALDATMPDVLRVQ
jgi:hypothetical protein